MAAQHDPFLQRTFHLYPAPQNIRWCLKHCTRDRQIFYRVLALFFSNSLCFFFCAVAPKRKTTEALPSAAKHPFAPLESGHREISGDAPTDFQTCSLTLVQTFFERCPLKTNSYNCNWKSPNHRQNVLSHWYVYLVALFHRTSFINSLSHLKPPSSSHPSSQLLHHITLSLIAWDCRTTMPAHLLSPTGLRSHFSL